MHEQHPGLLMRRLKWMSVQVNIFLIFLMSPFKDIRSGITIAISFLAVIALAWVTYAAIGTVNTGDSLTAAKWNELVNAVNGWIAVPSGAVIAFNLASCPSGWLPANGASGTPDLRGEFIRGLDWGRWLDPDSGRLVWSTQSDEIKSHDHSLNTRIWWTTHNAWVYPMSAWDGTMTNQWTQAIESTGWLETRPHNVALLYCVKQ